MCPACHQKVPQETLYDKLRRLQSSKPAFAAGDLATLSPVLGDPEFLEYSLLVATEVAPVRTIQDLLERGARVDISLTDFENPLVAAVDRGDLEVLRVLLSAKKWESYAGSALRRAVDGNNLAMFNQLLGAKSWAYDGEDAFSAACSQYKLDFAKALLEAGVNVNSKSQNTHATPLIWACQQHAQPINDKTA
ncbi:MAG: ankyrin repeat domain-containing protein, partial [Nevskiales bacterium]